MRSRSNHVLLLGTLGHDLLLLGRRGILLAGSIHTNTGIVHCEVVDKISRWCVHWVNVLYGTESLCVTLSYHNLGSALNKLDTVLELESDDTLIVGSHACVVLDLHSLYRLPDTADVEHTLETILNSCMMVKNLNESVEVLDT